MATLIDFQSNDALRGNGSLPFALSSGNEVPLATISLSSLSLSNRLVFAGTVCWQPDLALLTPVLPTLTLRIRQGGFAPNSPTIYETSDSAFIGTGILIPLISNPVTTTFEHTLSPTAVGPQSYFLTVTLSNVGSASIVGPVHLRGMTIGA
ncbi:hypothetical protein SAMN02799630_02750 [Paenibacillus sp. UNCCL117]|uniref:hypothetical protein n=1 Tax=unclassified Paenibacillus TaxID=185978 RepID=UPI00088C9208|nr:MULTISPECIES: hypothetical protein [unclassified Paenibacillus]SDD30845.1 hypothetical protein SAMN04488602_107218 [Paenibacillus sp. cl123]SFW40259.1 hypothetical protein SAMN02799630_02750 [Paenibacillus sp. UNCCL117]